MPVRRTCLALLLCVATLRADEGTGVKVEMRTIKGDIHTGELVSVSPAEVVVNKADGKVTVPTAQILLLDFPQDDKPAPPEKFLDVELVDGTVLHCASVAFKGKELKMTLVTGQELIQPIVKVSNILTQAQDVKHRKEWTRLLGQKKRTDIVTILKDGVPNHLEVTLGAVSEDGKKISFILEGDKFSRDIDKIHGLVWERAPDPNMPLAICKLIDVYGSVVMVQEIGVKGSEVSVTTPGGAKLTYPLKSIGKLDYNRDKLRYLSEMDPLKVVDPGTTEGNAFRAYKRDRNPDGKGEIKLAGQTYARGLSMNAYTELVYDLHGDYREFKTLAGIDTSVGDNNLPVTLIIECDGRERVKHVFTRKDKEPIQGLTINVKDVQKLRILVTSGDDPLSLGRHLTLADAKVMK
jgi:hypothetical protein